MIRLWHAWVAHLAAREDGTVLAVFRVLLALVILGTLGSIAAHGILELAYTDPPFGGYRTRDQDHWLVAALGGATARTAWALWGAAMGGSALLAVGLAARPAAFVTLQALIAFFSLSQETGGGHDRLLTNGLWLLVFADSAATLSLGCRLRTGAWSDPRPVPAWPRLVGLLQLALVYGTTGLHKMGAEWMPWGGYEAVYRALLQPAWTRFDFAPVAGALFPLTQLLTAVVWLWEVLFPLLLPALALRHRPGRLGEALRRVDPRWPFLGVGLGMHLFLGTALNLGPFSWITLSFSVFAFSPAELHAAAARLRRRPAAPPPAG